MGGSGRAREPLQASQQAAHVRLRWKVETVLFTVVGLGESLNLWPGHVRPGHFYCGRIMSRCDRPSGVASVVYLDFGHVPTEGSTEKALQFSGSER